MSSLALAMQIDPENPIVGDLQLQNGTVRFTSTLREEVAQQLYTRFNFFLGEWFLDPTQGFPWFQSVLGVKTPIGIVQQLLRRVIISCPGVASLQGFSMSNDTIHRTATVKFNCLLADGTVLTSDSFQPFIIGAV